MWNRKKIPKNKKKKRKTPSYFPYRSALEKRIAQKLSDDYIYEPKDISVNYETPHRYKPDFILKGMKDVLFEVKGYFRTSSEAAKYIYIKKNNPDLEIIFIFNNSFKKAHSNCRERVDGSIMTLAEWADKQEFLHYEEKSLPSEILQGTITKEWIKSERKKRGFKCGL